MRVFYQLLANNLVATVVNFTVWFAITFFVFLQTQSVLATSVISGLYVTTVAVTGFWLGGFVDHYSKRLMMMLSSLISLGCYVLGFALYQLAPAAAFTTIQSPWLWSLVVLSLLGVIVGNIRGIALPTLITTLIPEDKREKANGLSGTASGVSFLITSVISGILVGQSGMFGVFILAIVATVLTIVHLFFLKFDEQPLQVETTNETAEPKKLDVSGTLRIIQSIPGLLPLILFTMINNFLGGVFMSLMDAYGLSLVSVQVWGFIWGVLSTGFIVGGFLIAKFGLGGKPLRAMFAANLLIWAVCSIFTIQPSLILLMVGMYTYLCVVPFIEAAEHTIIQKVVPAERQGRVFGFAQSVEQSASPLTAFAIGPIAQFIFIPFMTTGRGVELIGDWFGTGPSRGIALVFTLTGIIGFTLTLIAMRSRPAKQLAEYYAHN